MQIIERIKPWLGRKSVRGAVVLIVLFLVTGILAGEKTADTTAATTAKPQVHLITPVEYLGNQSLSLIGTARAFTEAAVTAERAGRVVSVTVELGQTVQAGQVLGGVENASERAAVLQAEGVYEAAMAAAAQSGVGLEEAQTGVQTAKNAAVSTFQSAYNTTNGVVRNNIDSFFADPDAKVPGLRIDGRGLTTELNAERVAYQTLLVEWQNKANTISADADLVSELTYAKQLVQRTIAFVDTFLTVFAQQEDVSRYSETELQAFTATFTTQRSTLIDVQSSIDGAINGLASAQDAVRRAELAASGGTTSAADAQVKQALGALRAAQANLEKTIFRTPISGTVNAISVRTGDFVNSFAPVAIIANNGALEIVTYISDGERTLLNEGDVVMIEGAYEGRVTNIAPAVDTATGKTEVRIATEGTELVNGDTVRITKNVVETAVIPETIQVPLSAVKFTAENGNVFVVVDGHLEVRPVTLGVVRGGSVEILTGLGATESFVRDARGLQAGTAVDVIE